AGVQVHRRQQHRSGQGRPHARWHHHFHQCRYHPGGLARLERRQGGRGPQILEETGAEEMKTVPAEEFLLWAAEKGIRVDETKLLSMRAPREYSRFWVLPHDPTVWPYFIATSLAGLDEWNTGLLWPRSGRWGEVGQFPPENEAVRDIVLRGVGVPNGFGGAIRFAEDEKDALISILFVSLLFGWCVDDDLFF